MNEVPNLKRELELKFWKIIEKSKDSKKYKRLLKTLIPI